MLSRGCGRRHCGRDGSGGPARHSAVRSARRSTSTSSPSVARCLRSPSLSGRPSLRVGPAMRRSARRSRRADRRNRPSAAAATAPAVAEGAGLPLPAAIGGLRGADLVGAHPLEPVVGGIELADMIEAEPAPVARPVEAGPHARRARGTRRARRSRARRNAAPALRPARETASASCPRSPSLTPLSAANPSI